MTLTESLAALIAEWNIEKAPLDIVRQVGNWMDHDATALLAEIARMEAEIERKDGALKWILRNPLAHRGNVLSVAQEALAQPETGEVK